MKHKSPIKKVKPNEDLPSQQSIKASPSQLLKIYQKFKKGTKTLADDSSLSQILMKHESRKHPILPVLSPSNEVFKSSQDKKKKPIEQYLDTVNSLYKKKDLDVLINPIYAENVFEKWAPREVAIFEEGILKFGKQFEFIAELIKTKNPKDVFEFYNEWRFTSHYRQYKAHISANNRSNLEEYI